MTAKAKKALRKKDGVGEHAALTAPGAPTWKPTQSQRRAVDMVAIEPRLGTQHMDLCRVMQMHRDCWYRWNRNTQFRAWWNAQLIEIARLRSGPALMRLVQLIENPKTEPRDASKLADTFLKYVGVEATPNASGALIAIMEKWKGRRMRFAMEVDGGTNATDVPTTEHSYPPPDDLFSGLHKDHYQKQRTGNLSVENPPPGAMEVGGVNVERQARITIEEAGKLEGVGGSESQTGDGSGKGPHKLNIPPGADPNTGQPSLGEELLDKIDMSPNPIQSLIPSTIPPPGIVDPDDVDPEDMEALEELGLVDHVQDRMSKRVDDDG